MRAWPVLPAASYHAEVLRLHGPFTVSAVFSRSWHLRSADGWILTVTTAPYDGPLAIRLAHRSLEDLPVVPGTPATLTAGGLMVGDVSLDLHGARRWSPPSAGPPIDRSRLREQLQEIMVASPHPPSPFLPGEQGGRAHERYGGSPTPLEGEGFGVRGSSGEGGAAGGEANAAIGSAMTSLRDALVGDDAAAGEAALELLGLGPGLTPAGDDILCGCLAGLRLLGRRAGHSWDIDLEAFGASIVASARDRTTTLSRTLLARAAAGVVVEPLLAVLLSLGGDGAIGGLDALLSIGHSSGRDMLAGASLAAQVILEREGFSGAAVAAPA